MTRKAPLKRGNRRIAVASTKRRAELDHYEKVAKPAWRKAHDGRCEMILFGVIPAKRSLPLTAGGYTRCKRKADKSPHHLKGRSGALLCDTRFFCGLCSTHHRWVHDNARVSRELGYLLF